MKNTMLKSKTNLIIKMILLVILISSKALCQDVESNEVRQRKNAIFFEGLGHGILYSLNFERSILHMKRFHTSGQIGFSTYNNNSFFPSLLLPISLNQAIAINQREFFEIGVGRILVFDNRRRETRYNYQSSEWIFRLGFKYYFKNGKWMFKLAYTPYLTQGANLFSTAGVAFGYRF
ncbi:MAG: hypothetical protein AAF573_17255 [Bacteroidota bacterium]